MAASEKVTKSELLAKNLGRTLGITFRDCITGFEGTCTGVILYLYKEDMLELSPRGLDRDGKSLSPEWFAVERLRVVE